jgi:hypothetical protein
VTGDKILAKVFEQCGNCASGLDLSAIDEDGHAIANKLWKIAAYLKRRAQADEDGIVLD